MTRYQILAVLVMALFTYLPRFLPLTFFRKKITSKFINSALYYLPYAVLGALTFPGVFNSTPNLVESCAGILVAVFFSYKGKGLARTSEGFDCDFLFESIWFQIHNVTAVPEYAKACDKAFIGKYGNIM